MVRAKGGGRLPLFPHDGAASNSKDVSRMQYIPTRAYTGRSSTLGTFTSSKVMNVVPWQLSNCVFMRRMWMPVARRRHTNFIYYYLICSHNFISFTNISNILRYLYGITHLIAETTS